METVDEIKECLPVRFKQSADRQDVFLSNQLEVLKIDETEGKIRYWEDLRVANVCSCFDLPISEKDLQNLLNPCPPAP